MIVLVTVLVSVVSTNGFFVYFTVTVLSAVLGVTISPGTSFEVYPGISGALYLFQLPEDLSQWPYVISPFTGSVYCGQVKVTV